MRIALALSTVLVVACATVAQHTAPSPERPQSRYSVVNNHHAPLTRPERTNFLETSHYDDVVRFLDSLKLLGANVALGSMGKTGQGRDLPYVIASRPLVSTPAAAKALGRPVVYVEGNIHAGEVEGKEALQALVRDLVFDPHANVLDSIVLIAVPDYNADGNERFDHQARNRGAQNGPEMVGTRQTAQGINLNRDYMRGAAPETRAALAMFNAWDPDVYVDLHTTDGSYHGYALTYAGPLGPASVLTGRWTRDTILPAIRRSMRERDGFEIFDYGDFSSQDPNAPNNSWRTYGHEPRYGSNYYGLRNRIGILSEAFSHDPFPRRIASTYDFVQEILSYAAAHGREIVDRSRAADRMMAFWGANRFSAKIPLRARFTTHPKSDTVLLEQLVPSTDTTQSEPGVRRGMRRTGHIIPIRMPLYVEFEPTIERFLPYAWIIDAAAADSVLPLLQLHGIAFERLSASTSAEVSTFTIDSVAHPRGSEGHNETLLTGRWSAASSRPLNAGTIIVRAGQPHGILAAYLLEPESDDGIVTWNLVDPFLGVGRQFPIQRIERPVGK
jgi:murein tripeptide amidase MpaA